MRTMIFVASVGLAVTAIGCNDDNHRLDALESSNAVLTRMRADITTLKAQVAGLPAPVDTKPFTDRLDALEAELKALPGPVDTKPLTDRLDALEAKSMSGVKVPHLIIDKSGEDLGQLVGSAEAVWSTKLGGLLMSATSAPPIFYDQPQCAGAAFGRGMRAKSYMNGADGHLYKATGPVQAVQSQSYFDGNKCIDQFLATEALPIADTGLAPILVPPEQLRIELR